MRAVANHGLLFHGARLELCGGPVMVVIVDAAIMADVCGSQVLVQLLQAHAEETVVLMAQDERAVPTFYGPIDLVRILARMPFEAIPWRRYRFRPQRAAWRLPAPRVIAARPSGPSGPSGMDETPFVGTSLPTLAATVPG